MNFLTTLPHVDLMRGLFDLAITWFFAALWVVPPAGLCAIVWRASAAPPGASRAPRIAAFPSSVGKTGSR